MPVFAAVDIGANSVRLKIAELTRRKFTVVHEDREVTRLGESVFRNNVLAPDAMAHTVKVLQRFRKATMRFGAEQDGVWFSERDLAAPIVGPDARTYQTATAFIEANADKLAVKE